MGRRVICLFLMCFFGAFSSSALGGGPINSGETQSSSVGSASYTDTWTFTAQGGERVLINATKTSGTLAPRIVLYPPGGDPAEADSGALNYLSYQLQHAGTYTLVVQDFNLTKTGDYNLSFLMMPGTVSSPVDPDGGPIVSGQTLSATINAASDLDACQFDAQAGDRVLINATKTSGTVQPRIFLYPAGGGPVEFESGALNFLSYQLLQSGTYTIVIQDFSRVNTGNYNLTFLKIPGAVSSVADPDGGPIASGQTLSATINAASDLDACQFYAQTGERVLINTVKTSGTLLNIGPRIYLYPPGGGAAEADSGSLSYLSYQVQQTGLYTIVIQDFNRVNTGNYNVTFLKLPGAVSSAADPDGGPITSGQTLSGTINALSDLDAFHFYGQAGEQVLLNAVKTLGNLAPRLYLYPPGGGPAEADSGAATSLDCQLQDTGLYTIVVQDFMLLNTGAYDLSFDKIPATAGPGIYHPSPVNGATIYNVTGAFAWSAVAGATGYDLYFGEGVTQPLQKIGNNLASPSLAFPALARGKLFCWQVVAHTAGGDIQGPWCWFQVSVNRPSLSGLNLLLND